MSRGIQSTNAFTERGNPTYWYQYHDIEKIGKRLFVDMPESVVLASPLGRDRITGVEEFRKFLEDLSQGKMVVGAYNSGGNHWIAYCLEQNISTGDIRCLYKDSLDRVRVDFERTIKDAFGDVIGVVPVVGGAGGDGIAGATISRIKVIRLCPGVKEQKDGDGSNCGLFALHNIVRFATAFIGETDITRVDFYTPSYEARGLSRELLEERVNFAGQYVAEVCEEHYQNKARSIIASYHEDEAGILVWIVEGYIAGARVEVVTDSSNKFGYKYRIKAPESQAENIARFITEFLLETCDVSTQYSTNQVDADSLLLDFTFDDIRVEQRTESLTKAVEDKADFDVAKYMGSDTELLTTLVREVIQELSVKMQDCEFVINILSRIADFAEIDLNEIVTLNSIVDEATQEAHPSQAKKEYSQKYVFKTKPEFDTKSGFKKQKETSQEGASESKTESSDIQFFKFTKSFPAKKVVHRKHQVAEVESDSTEGRVDSIEKPPKKGDSPEKVAKDAQKFLMEGDLAIASQDIKEKMVMFVGVSGGGKSTLISYLGGAELKPIKKLGGEWGLEADKELPGISIGHAFRSETFCPKAYSPESSDFSYIDLPGFEDSRSEAHDIASSYFRAEIAKRASYLKIVIVVPKSDFSSAGRGVTLERAIATVANFLHSDESVKLPYISLVVTQVDTKEFFDAKREIKEKQRFIGYAQAVGDEDVVESLVSRISELQMLVDSQESESKREAMVLLESFEATHGHLLTEFGRVVLHQIKENFAIFSKYYDQTQTIPDDEKALILESINEAHFVEKSQLKVKIIVSDSSKNAIHRLADIASEASKVFVTKIAEIIGRECDYLQDTIEDQEGFAESEEKLSNIRECLVSILESDSSGIFKMAGQFEELVPHVGVKLEKLSKWINYLEFCKRVNDEVIYISGAWGEEILKFVEEKLDECRIASELNQFNLLLEEMCQDKIKSSESYNEMIEYLNYVKDANLSKSKDIEEFLEKVSILSEQLGVEFPFIPKNTNKWGLEFLEKVENQINTIVEPVKSEFVDSSFELKVTGYFVTATHITDNLSIVASKGLVKSVKVFAVNTIFLDQNLTYPGLNMSIVSPNWKITIKGGEEERVIDLSGEDGENIVPAKASNGANVIGQNPDGSGIDGNHGLDGLPGNPGKPGGNFFGVCKKFYHIKDCKFTINVSGGDGGKGQDGGDGSNGTDGRNCPLAEISISNEPKSDIVPIYIKEIKRADLDAASQILHITKCVATYNSKYIEAYLVRGGKGGIGGNGGKGGKGGVPGLPGNSTILPDFPEQGLVVIQSVGDDGIPGDGGSFGTAGISGTGYYGEYCSEEMFAGIRRSLSGRKILSLNEEITSMVRLGIVGEIIRHDYQAKVIEEERINKAFREKAANLMQQMTQGGGVVAAQVTKETVKEFTKVVVVETSKETAKSATKEAGKEIVKQVFHNSLELSYGEMLKEISKKLVTEFGQEAANTMITDVSKALAKETAAAISKDISKDTIKFMTSEVTRDLTKQLAKEVSSEVIKGSAIEASKSTFISSFVTSLKAGFTVANIAKGVGISAALSVISVYMSSGWTIGPIEVEGSIEEDGMTSEIKNTKEIKYPSESDSTISMTELLEEYSLYLEKCPLIAENSPFTEDFTI